MKYRVCCIIMCLLLAGAAIHAASADTEIMPCYAYTNSIEAKIDISGGTAKAEGKIVPSGGQRTAIIVYLQKENSSGRWTTLAVWSGSNDAGISKAGGSKEVTSGYNYRVKVLGKVYDSSGTVIESITTYSPIKAY